MYFLTTSMSVSFLIEIKLQFDQISWLNLEKWFQMITEIKFNQMSRNYKYLLQSPSEIIGTTAKNSVVPDVTSNEQPL